MPQSSNANFSRLEERTLTRNPTITWSDADILALDPGGASRSFTLPTGGEHRTGSQFLIINTANANENLSIAASQLITDQAITIGRGESALCTYMGVEITETVPGNRKTQRERGWAVGVLGLN